MAKKSQVIDRDLGWKKIRAKIKEMEGQPHVVVGVRAKDADKQKDDAPAGTTMLVVASVHEYGSEDGTIPERSYIRSTTDANARTYQDALEVIYNKMISPYDSMHLGVALKALGMLAEKDIREKIRSNIPPKHSQATLDERERRRPGVAVIRLIDTGQLIQSISSAAQYEDGRPVK